MVEIRIVGALYGHLEPMMKLDLGGGDVTVADLLTRLRIDAAEVGIVTVDGWQSNSDWIIPPDARVFIFPPLLGG
jgi:hypothetical protein